MQLFAVSNPARRQHMQKKPLPSKPVRCGRDCSPQLSEVRINNNQTTTENSNWIL